MRSESGIASRIRISRVIVALALVALSFIVPAPAPATAPTVEGTPPPTLRPVPTPASSIASPPIVVTKDDVTIDGVTISGALNGDGEGIRAIGTADKPIRNLTIRNCTIKGFNVGIEARYVVNLVIEGCLIQDAGYGGILVYSGIGGRITGNTIARIGVGIPTNGSTENNAYGIALSRIATSSFTHDPRTSDFLVDGNVVEDVPLWHGLDTHAGSHITFSNNVIRRCARPIFITVDGAGNHPTDITVTGNRLEAGVEVPEGTNMRAITLVNLQGGTITNNVISSTFPEPYLYDYLGLDPTGSTGLTISGQTVIP